MVRSIIKYPDPILKKESAKIDLKNLEVLDLPKKIIDFNDTLQKAKGVGLAAVQVGLLEKLFIALRRNKPILMINPEITWMSTNLSVDEEGCLSIPDTWATIERAESIRMTYFNIHGIKEEVKARGMFARILQHEYDHLNGILIIDRSKKIRYETKDK